MVACASPVSPPVTQVNKVELTKNQIKPQPTQSSQSTHTPRPTKPTQTTLPPEPVITSTVTLFPEEVLHTVTDEYHAIEAVLPEAWKDMRSEPWVNKEDQIIGTTYIVSTNIDEFLNFKAEGVAISVSNRLGMGYIQLMDEEANLYRKICEDSYKTTWPVEHPVYRGKYVVLGCSSHPDSWLDVEVVVNKNDPAAYVVRVIALDMVPTYGDKFRDIINRFQIFPENIP
jgi:hypothetical protein